MGRDLACDFPINFESDKLTHPLPRAVLTVSNDDSVLRQVKMIDVVVIGGGPAGMTAALRAGDLGAKTVLVTRDEFGGMAANDGPVPVRTLAHAARLLRDARNLVAMALSSASPARLHAFAGVRVSDVVEEVRAHSTFRTQLRMLGVVVNERCGDRSLH